jgi:GT2 family glycosyltransferase
VTGKKGGSRFLRRLRKLFRNPAGFAIDLPNPVYRAMLLLDLRVLTAARDILDVTTLAARLDWRRFGLIESADADIAVLDRAGRSPRVWPRLISVTADAEAAIALLDFQGQVLSADVAGPGRPAVLETGGRAFRIRTYAVTHGAAPRLKLAPVTLAGALRVHRLLGLTENDALRRVWPRRALRPGRLAGAIYRKWLARNPPLQPPLSDRSVSILMPVRDPSPLHLKAAIDSVFAQSHQAWQLCLSDDGSRDPRILALLAKAADRDPRVSLIRSAESSGISNATNAALGLATGEVCLFLDHDDVLAPEAVGWVASAFDSSMIEAVYSDEGVIDGQGRHRSASLKAAFDPERLLAQNYINHLCAVRTATLRALGGLDPSMDGSQDHDLLLRIAARSDQPTIRHLPYILYYWRRARNGRAFSQQQRGRADAARQAAVRRHLQQRGQAAEVSAGYLGFNRIRWTVGGQPPVEVIIPTRDRPDLLAACVAGLQRRTDYSDLRIAIVDNGSVQPRTLRLLDSLAQDPSVRVISAPGDFNHSKLNNLAAVSSTAATLVLLNDDILVTDKDWLREMLGWAQRPGIGAVGSLLLYPDGRIQHAGVTLGLGSHRIAGHDLRGAPGDLAGPGYQLKVARSASAVTAACLMIQRDRFLSVGGFDEETFPIAFNDVDLCLRLANAGLRTVWTPHARLVHRESASRGKVLDDAFLDAVNRMHRRWGGRLKHDPYFHPALSPDDERWSVSNQLWGGDLR